MSLVFTKRLTVFLVAVCTLVVVQTGSAQASSKCAVKGSTTNDYNGKWRIYEREISGSKTNYYVCNRNSGKKVFLTRSGGRQLISTMDLVGDYLLLEADYKRLGKTALIRYDLNGPKKKVLDTFVDSGSTTITLGSSLAAGGNLMNRDGDVVAVWSNRMYSNNLAVILRGYVDGESITLASYGTPFLDSGVVTHTAATTDSTNLYGSIDLTSRTLKGAIKWQLNGSVNYSTALTTSGSLCGKGLDSEEFNLSSSKVAYLGPNGYVLNQSGSLAICSTAISETEFELAADSACGQDSKIVQAIIKDTVLTYACLVKEGSSYGSPELVTVDLTTQSVTDVSKTTGIGSCLVQVKNNLGVCREVKFVE